MDNGASFIEAVFGDWRGLSIGRSDDVVRDRIGWLDWMFSLS